MPTYEYGCLKCGATKEIFASLAEKEAGLDVICPKCGSKEMVQFFGGVNISKSKKGGHSGCSCCG